MANRLSENYSVLLLEAGGEPHPLHMIPAFSGFLLNYPEVDWMHKTVPQKHSSYAMNHRVNSILIVTFNVNENFKTLEKF